jgi:hypothetical protein
MVRVYVVLGAYTITCGAGALLLAVGNVVGLVIMFVDRKFDWR